MTKEEELAHWMQLLADLQAVMTIADIADVIGVDDREVWRWKAGERRPMGLNAVRVYTLHVKRCPDRQCLTVHSAITGNIAM